ncbi:MAG: UDP-3-O-acylglucosamine N-acyltransferase [Planctomycetota bacterium]|nr:MAG: UDP-3-O-acylglucosamine N-acyltransferase [Planctomycetota bacterium]
MRASEPSPETASGAAWQPRRLTARELAALLGGQLEGEPETEIADVAAIEQAGPGDLSFVANPAYERYLATSRAACVLVSPTLAVPPGRTVIRCSDPYLAFAQALELFRPPAPALAAPGIHPSAVIDPAAQIDPSACVGPCAVVQAGARVEARAVIGALAYIGHRVRVGAETVVHPRAVLLHDTEVGMRCTIHAGAVLGADGFGFALGGGGLHKVPQRGRVVLEDEVEIGANTTIDRATFGETRIGTGTKIDNQVQIAHNVVVGPYCAIAAQAGIAGSTRLGSGCLIGAQAGIVGHLRLGDGVVVAASAGVTRNVDAGAVLGQPAVPIEQGRRAYALIGRLPEMRKEIAELRRRLQALQARLEQAPAPDGGG